MSLLVAVLAASSVQSQTAATFRLASSSFHSTDSHFGQRYNPDGYVHGVSSGSSAGCLVAAVDLPVGAEITAIRAHLWNNDPGDIGIRLKRKRVGQPVISETMASVFTNVTAPAVFQFTTTNINNPVVSQFYSYYLATSPCPDNSSQRIYAVDIDYLGDSDALIFADGFESGDALSWSSSTRSSASGSGAATRGLATIRVGAMEFKSDRWFVGWDSNIDGGYFSNADGGSGSGTLCLALAPVELPDGAQIAGMIAYIRDSTTTNGAVVRLRKAPLSTTASPLTVATITSSTPGAPSGWQVLSDLSASNGDVDNAAFWFYLEWCNSAGEVPLNLGDLAVQSVDVLYSPL